MTDLIKIRQPLIDLRKLVEIDHYLRKQSGLAIGQAKEDLLLAAQLISKAVYESQQVLDLRTEKGP